MPKSTKQKQKLFYILDYLRLTGLVYPVYHHLCCDDGFVWRKHRSSLRLSLDRDGSLR